MKKIKIDKELISGKFIAINEDGYVLTTTLATEREIGLIYYPAVFNTEEDVKKIFKY